MYKQYIASFLLALIVAVSAYAQNTASTIIADVDLTSQSIVSQVNRLFTINIGLINNIGTQTGILYGVQVFAVADGERTLVDELAINDPLTLSQGEVVNKQFVYPLPQSIGGTLELFAFLKTDKGIPLSMVSLGEVSVEKAQPSVAFDGCSIDTAKNALVCNLVNNATTTQTAILSASVKQGTSPFAPLIAVLPPQERTLVPRQKDSVQLEVNSAVFQKDAFFDVALLQKETGLLVERSSAVHRAPVQARSIDNVLINQTSAREYSLRIISLQGGTPVPAQAQIVDSKGVCATQAFTLAEPVTELVFNLEKRCDTTLISVATYNPDQSLREVKEIPHRNLFPATFPVREVVAGVLVIVVGLGFVLFVRRRNNK